MVAIITDAAGNPLYATPSLRLGVDPGRSATANLNDAKYNLNIPAGVMRGARGIAIIQRYDPNDIRKIISDVIAGIVSVAWIAVILLFF
jgi:hypothetical protein